MFNESLFTISVSELQDVIFHEWTIFNVALTYVLGYIVYKSLGRYIYFKPQEHASKINRTFLSLALLVVILHFLSEVVNSLPFLLEYRWLYGICSLSLLVAVVSIITDRIVWKYNKDGYKQLRYRQYLPVKEDYYKTTVTKTEARGNYVNDWEEEVVISTQKNIHSDVLLNVAALATFIIIGVKWTCASMMDYGLYSSLFAVVVFLWTSAIFIDSSVFSWIGYLESRRHK